MRRLRFVLNLIVLLVPIVILGIGAVRLVRSVFGYLNSNRRLAGTISAEATRALGRVVRVRDVRITGNLWSLDAANRIDLMDVYVANGPRASDGAFATARKVVVWYNLRQVLANDRPLAPLVDEVRLDSPEILLQRSRTGRWNYQDLVPTARTTARSFTDKISFTNGVLLYSDRAVPHPAGVPDRPLDTRLTGLKGIVLIHPDKTFAFDVAGVAQPAYMQDFHVTGSVVPSPLRLETRVVASQVTLQTVAERLMPPAQLRVRSGHANMDVGVLYVPPIGTSPRRLDTKALIAHGTVQVFDGSADGKLVYAPVEHLNGLATFTTDSILGNLSGDYAGMPVRLEGAILGINLPPLGGGERATAPVTPPTISVRGAIQGADWQRVSHLGFVPALLGRLPQYVRQNLRTARFQGDLQFQAAGKADNPEAALAGHVARVEYSGYRGDNVDVRAVFANHMVHASVKGRYAGGDAVLHGTVALDAKGAFEAQAQGRSLDLARLGAPIPVALVGRGRLDFAIRGMKGRTPSITAQAEADNVTVNGQALRHVFAKADTSGPDLVVRTLTAEDPKGFVVATGTIGMKSRRLDLTVDADELNFRAIAKAAMPRGSSGVTKPIAAHPAVNSAIGRLADIDGFGYARTRLTGTIDKPSLEGRVYAFGVQMGAVELDKVTLSDFKISKDELRVDGIASKYPGQVRVAGSVQNPFSQSPELKLDTRVESLDLATLLQLAGVDRKDLVLTGTLTTDNIPVRGTLSSPQTPNFFTANLQNATVNGLSVRNAALTVRYQVEGLYVKNASAVIADGLVVGSGWLPFEGPINFTVHGGGLALQQLEEAAYTPSTMEKAPATVRGDANFDAAITGTLKQPVVTVASLDTDVLSVNGFKLGSIKAKGRYADRQMRIASLTLTGPNQPGRDQSTVVPNDGLVTINGLTYNLDSHAIRTDPGHPIRADSIPLQRIHDLAYAFVDSANDEAHKLLDDFHDVTGPISATAALGGTLDEPQVDLTWNGANLRAKNYEITSLTGSAYIDKNKLIYPSPATPSLKFKIESPYVDIQSPSDPRTRNIVVEFDRPGHVGQIRTIVASDVRAAEAVPADISISNINLAFLQQFLDKSIARKIDGAGDIAITAQGRTMSPNLEFSANLRNVAVYSAIDLKAHPITLDRVDLLQGTIAEGAVKIGSLRAIKIDPVTHTPYETSASATLTGFTYEPPFLPPEAKLVIDGSLPVQFIAVAVPGVLRDTSRGVVTLHVGIQSLREHQTVTGQVVADVPRLEFAALATGIQDLSARLNLNNDRLTVQSFTAHTYIYGRPKDVDTDLSAAVAALPGSAAATPAASRGRRARAPAKVSTVSENDPKRRGSEIQLTGSIPLGFKNDRTTGPDDGIIVRIFDPHELPADQLAAIGSGKQPRRTPANAVALTFNEDPLPNSRNGVLKGTVRTDPNRPLRIRGSAREPILTGRMTLYNASITPPSDQKPGLIALPILPSFDLALQLGPNVRVHTSQLDARLSTDRDIVAHGRLLQNNNDLNLEGTVQISDGKLRLPAASFTILPGASLHVNYPTMEAGENVLGLNIDLKARGTITATSMSGVRKRYQVTVTARGPLTGDNVDPLTGRPTLALSFETSPNDLAASQQLLTERLAGAIVGVDSLELAGRNPGQAMANVLSGVFTGSVLPGIFDRTAASLGFEELALGYDPVDRLTLNISRHLFGPLYVSYYRTLSATQERYDLKVSFRFRDRYQLSFDLDEQHTQKLLLEGVWKF